MTMSPGAKPHLRISFRTARLRTVQSGTTNARFRISGLRAVRNRFVAWAGRSGRSLELQLAPGRSRTVAGFDFPGFCGSCPPLLSGAFWFGQGLLFLWHGCLFGVLTKLCSPETPSRERWLFSPRTLWFFENAVALAAQVGVFQPTA